MLIAADGLVTIYKTIINSEVVSHGHYTKTQTEEFDADAYKTSVSLFAVTITMLLLQLLDSKFRGKFIKSKILLPVYEFITTGRNPFATSSAANGKAGAASSSSAFETSASSTMNNNNANGNGNVSDDYRASNLNSVEMIAPSSSNNTGLIDNSGITVEPPVQHISAAAFSPQHPTRMRESLFHKRIFLLKIGVAFFQFYSYRFLFSTSYVFFNTLVTILPNVVEVLLEFQDLRTKKSFVRAQLRELAALASTESTVSPITISANIAATVSSGGGSDRADKGENENL